jgi:hypothetical protein
MKQEKLEAIAERALNGDGEERTVARKILEERGLNPEDILEQKRFIDTTFKFKDRFEKKIIMQAYAAITNQWLISYTNEGKRKIGFRVDVRYAEQLVNLVGRLIKSWRKDLRLFELAFIAKNSLEPSSEAPNENHETDITSEEVEKWVHMASAIQQEFFGPLFDKKR